MDHGQALVVLVGDFMSGGLGIMMESMIFLFGGSLSDGVGIECASKVGEVKISKKFIETGRQRIKSLKASRHDMALMS